MACSANCIDGVTRTIWDGDQVLYEIRRPMASAETETGVVPDGTPDPHQYGRVGYMHGGGLDKPLAIYRMDYDTMFPAAQLLAPHTDARGAYEAGTHSVTGMSMPCRTMLRTVVDATPYPSDDPENPPSPHADSVQVCVKVDFPAAKQWMTYSPRNTSQLGAYAWWGSLISGARDESGQMYMRNRYDDPAGGRFAQDASIAIPLRRNCVVHAFSCLLRIAIVCVVLQACADARTDGGGPGDDASLIGELDGSWKRVGSTGGAMAREVVPDTSHQQYGVRFASGRRYAEISSEREISYRGAYSVERGVTFEEFADTVLLVQLQQALWGGYFSPATEFAVNVRGDTLELVEASSHAWSHRFIRIARDSAETRQVADDDRLRERLNDQHRASGTPPALPHPT